MSSAGGGDPAAREAGGAESQPTGNGRERRGCFRFKASRDPAGRRIRNEAARAVRFARHAFKAAAVMA